MADSRDFQSFDEEFSSDKVYCANCIHCKLIKIPKGNASQYGLRVRCDAILIGTANYFSYEAGMVKDFFDRTFFTLKGKVDGKPYATFGSAGNGGDKALNSLNKLCDNLGLKKAADSVLAFREPTSEVLNASRALGNKIALL